MEIRALLQQDHARIERAIAALCESAMATTPSAVATLRETVQRHMFVEELAIFTFLRIENDGDVSGMATLQREHDQILQHFDRLAAALQQSVPDRIEEQSRALQQCMAEHLRNEDETLYRRLDSDLSEQQKRTVLMRIQACSG